MIRRSPRPDIGWSTFSNDVLADSELSFRALGVLVYILSKPDDWTVRAEELAASHAEGRDAVLTAMEHLELAGYMVRRRYQNSRGHWQQECVVYDRPVDRNLVDNHDRERVSRARSSGAGEPGPLTRTDDQGLNTKENTRGAARRRDTGRPKGSFQPKEADDTTASSDEPAALGSSPRPSRSQRDETAATRGTSGVGLAMRLRSQLETNGATGEMLNVNVAALGKQLTSARKRGTSWEVLAKAVELYAKNPTRYTGRDAVKGWTGFLAALPKLVDDAGKHQRADAGGARFAADPYAGVTE